MSMEDEEDIKRDRAVKTKVFADVGRQINNMKTDHIRGKIFARKEADGTYIDSDSDGSNESVKVSPKNVRRKSILKKPKYGDEDDDITPYDSVSNVGRLRDRQHDFDDDDDNEPATGDIAEDIVKRTMNQYRSDRKQFNKDVGMYESDEEEEKPQTRRIGGKTLEQRLAEDPMDLTATRRRLHMTDPDDPLDPNNIEKLLEEQNSHAFVVRP